MATNGENGQNTQEFEKLEDEKIKQAKKWHDLFSQIAESARTQSKYVKLDEDRKKALRQNYRKSKDSVKAQIRELKELKNFPKNIDDMEAMYKWVKDNSDALVLLNNDEIQNVINDKEINEAARQTLDIRKNILRWFGIYNEDILRPAKAKDERIEDLKKFEEIDRKDITAEEKEEEKEEIRVKRAKEESDRKARVEKQKKQIREELKNQKEYAVLGVFAENLSEAGNSHDKDDYKQLIKMLSELGKGGSDEALYPNDWDVMSTKTEAQKTALPYFRIKGQINKYLAHKAKDGVKAKDLKKLAAVEELNKYVSQKIKDLKPEPFQLGNTVFNKDDIDVTYDEEFTRMSDKDSDLCNTSSNDYLYEQQATAYNDSHKGKSYIDPEVLKNASACMDRIMLKVQINKKDIINRIPKDLSDMERKNIIKQKILKDFTKVKDVLTDSPIKTKKSPVQEKQNNDPGIGI